MINWHPIEGGVVILLCWGLPCDELYSTLYTLIKQIYFRFEGGGCEECSLLAEALSTALQVCEFVKSYWVDISVDCQQSLFS